MRRFLIAISLFAAVPLAAQNPGPWDGVARILKAPATPQAGYTRFNFPRRDLVVTIGDVTVAPALALGTWLGFSGDPADADVMGDLVLTEQEVGPVQEALLRQGIMITATHNHLVGDHPHITYVHVHAHGDAATLAARFDTVLSRSAVPRPVTPSSAPLSIDTARVFAALGQPGRAQGAVAQLGFMFVSGAVQMDGRTLVPAMAYGSPINVQMVNANRAVATGDFSVPANHVEAVRNALVSHGITVTALHSHLVGETPAVYYMHFWADGPLDTVLTGLRAGIDAAR